jgi:hypothetical protein
VADNVLFFDARPYRLFTLHRDDDGSGKRNAALRAASQYLQTGGNHMIRKFGPVLLTLFFMLLMMAMWMTLGSASVRV